MKILAAIKKEFLLLWRDKIGLLILFILPMCLVLFITLTSTEHGDNKPMNKLNILVVDQDKNDISQAFKKALDKVALFNVETSRKNQAAAKAAVIDGQYQAAVIIPANTTEHIQSYLQTQLTHGKRKVAMEGIQVYLDPGMPIPVKDTVITTLQLITSQIETGAAISLLGQSIRQPKLDIPPDFIDLKTTYVTLNKNAKAPNSAEYNVPAWTLFGMFFIVIPLAGVMVRERELGVHQRLEVAPVWHVNLMLGRITTFVGLNLIQLWLMLAVGVYILPLFDVPTLQVANHIGLIFLAGICTALAATGFGLLIGTWASTYEQATVVGPFLIVIASAIGGIMAPVDLMPELLQQLSAFSPLNWAQNAFIDIFVRDATFKQILPWLLKLLGFFVLMLLLSLLKFVHIKSVMGTVEE